MARHAGIIGVDIGSAAIKLVELSNGGSPKVRAVASVATPAGALEEGRIKDPQAVGKALRGLIQSKGIKTKRAVTAVNGQVALMREVHMPPLPVEEIKQAARFEVERYLPYPIADVTFDTVVVGEGGDGDKKGLDVLVVAARTDVLRQHMAALQTAGLEPAVLEVEPLAVVRAVASNATKEQVTACIHIGSSVTMILVAEGQVPRVIRTVAFGTTQLLEAAASRLGATGKEQAGLQARLATAAQANAQAGGAEAVPGLREAIDDALLSLVTEIRRSLEYYGGRFRTAVPDRVVVTGGGATLPDVTASLTAALDMPVERGDPFVELGEPPAGMAPEARPAYAVAAGLARRGVSER
jgi:type IV pilus assembly protein PilM